MNNHRSISIEKVKAMNVAITYQQHVACAEKFNSCGLFGDEILAEQKWMAVSQMQKSIRRGERQLALSWANSLWKCDPAYALFRTGVIAAEEIAGANPALARAFLQTEIKKKWFDDRNGFESYAYFIDGFAQSVKDRTSCDIASIASLTSLPNVKPRGELDYDLLRKTAEDVSQPVPARVSALWLLAGTQKSPNPNLGMDRPGRLIDYLGACANICNDADVIYCIDMSLRLNKEPNAISLALCRSQQSDGNGVVLELTIPTQKIGRYVLSGVDAHTREGRAAIGELLAASQYAKAMTANLSSHADKTQLLGKVFFRLEGHECSPRLDYELALKTNSWHRKKLAKISRLQEAELFGLANDCLPLLNELRQKQANPQVETHIHNNPKPN